MRLNRSCHFCLEDDGHAPSCSQRTRVVETLCRCGCPDTAHPLAVISEFGYAPHAPGAILLVEREQDVGRRGACCRCPGCSGWRETTIRYSDGSTYTLD